MNFYVSLFADAAVTSIRRYGPEGPGKEGSVMQATFACGPDLHVRRQRGEARFQLYAFDVVVRRLRR